MDSCTWVRIREGDRVGVAGTLLYPAWSTVIFNGDAIDTQGSGDNPGGERNEYDERIYLLSPKQIHRAGEYQTIQVSLFAGPGGFAGLDIFVTPKDASANEMKFVKYLRVDPGQNPPGLPKAGGTSATVCFLIDAPN